MKKLFIICFTLGLLFTSNASAASLKHFYTDYLSKVQKGTDLKTYKNYYSKRANKKIDAYVKRHGEKKYMKYIKSNSKCISIRNIKRKYPGSKRATYNYNVINYCSGGKRPIHLVHSVDYLKENGTWKINSIVSM